MTMGYSSISLLDLLQALRTHLFNFVHFWGGVVDNNVQELLSGISPPGAAVRHCTFRIPDFDQRLSQIKRNPTYGFTGLSMHGGAMAQVISIGSMLVSNDHVGLFQSMWAPHGLVLDQHFILAFDNSYSIGNTTNNPINSFFPVLSPGGPTVTTDNGELERGQRDPTNDILLTESQSRLEVDHSITNATDIKATLLLGGFGDIDVEACRFRGHSKIIPSAKSTFAMENVLRKLNQITGQDLTDNILPLLGWSPASYKNKIQLFSWAQQMARGHQWAPQEGEGWS